MSTTPEPDLTDRIRTALQAVRRPDAWPLEVRSDVVRAEPTEADPMPATMRVYVLSIECSMHLGLRNHTTYVRSLFLDAAQLAQATELDAVVRSAGRGLVVELANDVHGLATAVVE